MGRVIKNGSLGIRVVESLAWWSLEQVTAKFWCSPREFPKSHFSYRNNFARELTITQDF
jgi:hypothetical protein